MTGLTLPPPTRLTFDHANPHIPLEGKSEELTESTQEIDRIALMPFKDTVIPQNVVGDPPQKEAFILWGPPGSGKTTWGHHHFEEAIDAEKRKTYVTIAYDERGAIDDIPHYKEKQRSLFEHQQTAEADGNHERAEQIYLQRLALYRKNRANSQRIRSKTFNQAIQNGQNLFIDITASGRGATLMLDKLHQLGYKTYMQGYYASLQTAERRVSSRAEKVVEPSDIYNKRIDALKSFHELIIKSHFFRLYLNEVDGARPTHVVTYRDQGKVSAYSPRNISAFRTMLQDDTRTFSQHPEQAVRNQSELMNTVQAALRLPSETALVA